MRRRAISHSVHGQAEHHDRTRQEHAAEQHRRPAFRGRTRGTVIGIVRRTLQL